MSVFPDQVTADELIGHVTAAVRHAYAQMQKPGKGNETLILTTGAPLRSGEGGIQILVAAFPVADQQNGVALAYRMNGYAKKGWRLWKQRQNYKEGWGKRS